MVSVDRVKQKLLWLLVSGKTTKRKAWNEFMKKRYQLQMLKKCNPQKINSLTDKFIVVLEEIDREISN
jgi:hypothetical protein